MEVADGDACGISVGVAAAVGMSSTTDGTSAGGAARSSTQATASRMARAATSRNASFIHSSRSWRSSHASNQHQFPCRSTRGNRVSKSTGPPSRNSREDMLCGNDELGDPKRDCPVVEGDLDAVGVVTWQHPLGAPCLWLVLCFQTTIPEAREHFFTPSTRCHTHPFGGLGVRPPLATWGDEIKSLHYQVHSGLVTKSPFSLIGRGVCLGLGRALSAS